MENNSYDGYKYSIDYLPLVSHSLENDKVFWLQLNS